MARLYSSLEERLIANSALSEEHWWLGQPCWDWIGKLSKAKHRPGAGAYPIINIRIPGKGRARHPKTYKAHRVSYETFTGKKLRKGQEINHLCGRTCCINPAHLEACSRTKNEQYKHWLKRLHLRVPAPEAVVRQPGEDDEPYDARTNTCDEHGSNEEIKQ